MLNQTKYIVFGFSRNSQNPLDPRLQISSLSAINTELKLIHRYAGLIFFVKDVQKHYLFLNNLNTPIALQTLLTNGQINGILSTDYSTLISDLNATNPTLGSLVTIFPLKTTFIFDGTNWSYHSGEYNFTDLTQAGTLPNSLKKQNVLINIGNLRYLFKADLTISTEVIVDTVIPTLLESNRYYSINGILYFSLSGILYKLSEKFLLFENKNLIVGNNNITHNFNSTYISGLLWINISDSLQTINEIIPLQIKNVNANQCNIVSSLNVTGNLLLTSNY